MSCIRIMRSRDVSPYDLVTFDSYTMRGESAVTRCQIDALNLMALLQRTVPATTMIALKELFANYLLGKSNVEQKAQAWGITLDQRIAHTEMFAAEQILDPPPLTDEEKAEYEIILARLQAKEGRNYDPA